MSDRKFNVSILLGVVDKASAQLGMFEKKIKNNEEAMKGFRIAGTAMTGMAVAGAAAILALTNKASDLQETQSKFSVVMGKQIDLAEKWSNELVAGYAMSELESKKYLSSMQDLLKPMGMAEDQAAMLSNQIVRLAADIGSFNNMPTANVMADIQSAMTGMVIPMKKYGVVLSAELIKQEALNMGLYRGKGELDNTARAMATYSLIVKGSKDALGDMSRTQDSYANLTKKMKAQIDNLVTSLGTNFIPVMSRVVERVTGLIESFNKLSPGTKKLITDFMLYGTVLMAFSGPATSLIGFSGQIAGGIKAVAAATKTSAGMFTAYLAIILAVYAAAKIVVALYDDWANKTNKAKEEQAKFNKTLEGKIAIMEQDKKRIIDAWKTNKMSEDEARMLLEKRNRSIRDLQEQIDIQKEKEKESINAAVENADIKKQLTEEELQKQIEYQNKLFEYEVMTNAKTLEDKKNTLIARLAETEKNTLAELDLKNELYETEMKLQEQAGEYNDAMIEYKKARGEDAYEFEKKLLQDKLANVREGSAEEIKIKTKMLELEKEHAETVKKLEDEKKDKKIKVYQELAAKTKEYVGMASNVMNEYYDLLAVKIQNNMNQDIDSADQQYQEKKKWIEANVKDETEKTRQLQELEEGYNAQVANIKDKAARDEKKLKEQMKPILIAEAIANTAVGATKALAQGGIFGFIGAASVVAAGAIQIAKIQAQKFAKGVRNFGGGFAMVNEEGPELIHLPRGSDVYTAGDTKKMLGGQNITIQVTGNTIVGVGGAQQLADILGETIIRKVRLQRAY